MVTLSSFIPWNMNTLILGHHFLNSCTQLCKVDLGTITMCGPVMFLKCFKYPRNEIVCKVFPSPYISTIDKYKKNELYLPFHLLKFH